MSTIEQIDAYRWRLPRDGAADLAAIVAQMRRTVPAGVGAHRRDLRLGSKDLRQVLARGAAWAVSRGFGDAADLDHVEEGGRLPDADPELVSDRAEERGRTQLGTLGSGNHCAELQYVAEIYDYRIAHALG